MVSLHVRNPLADLPRDPEAGSRVRVVRGAVWSEVDPTPVRAPTLLAASPEVAALLGVDVAALGAPGATAVLAGNARLPGSAPYATNYGGHQFGHWAGQLGDGRAISLGVVDGPGGPLELQLKGAGPTPYARRADGRAVLRSSIREFLCSEAMAHLGVPTTRALSLVGTGEGVWRDPQYDGNPRWEPGAVVCRVAPSFLRFGHVELPASRGEQALVAQVVDATIAGWFPDLPGAGAARRAAWFAEVCARTASLMVHWRRVGFVHGVMNTDNLSVLGLTLDYGPYGFLDAYDPSFTPNTTDLPGRRYRFGAQAEVARWNLACLAQALVGAVDDPDALVAALEAYPQQVEQAWRPIARGRFGFAPDDPSGDGLVAEAERRMVEDQVDYLALPRLLATLEQPALDPLLVAWYGRADTAGWTDWLARWWAAHAVDRAAACARIRASVPAWVPRNWLVQQAIDLAVAGDPSGIHAVLDAARRPEAQDVRAGLRPSWAATHPGCTALSCSS